MHALKQVTPSRTKAFSFVLVKTKNPKLNFWEVGSQSDGNEPQTIPLEVLLDRLANLECSRVLTSALRADGIED